MIAIGTVVAFRLALAPLVAAEPDWEARYAVRFARSDSGTPTAAIEAVFRWTGKPETRPAWIDLEMAEDGFPGGYGSFVRGAAAFVPDGSPAPAGPYRAEALPAPTGRYHLSTLADGSAGIRYSVVL